MDFMVYPVFEFNETRGLFLPVIRLPRNYKSLVKKFHEQNRKPDIEEYKEIVQKEILNNEQEINLKWNDERGLEHISLDASGLDLDDDGGWPNFQEHNLGKITGKAAGYIAMRYISELLRSE